MLEHFNEAFCGLPTYILKYVKLKIQHFQGIKELNLYLVVIFYMNSVTVILELAKQ